MVFGAELLTFSLATAADLCLSLRYSAVNEEEVDFAQLPKLFILLSSDAYTKLVWEHGAQPSILFQCTMGDLYQPGQEIRGSIVLLHIWLQTK